MIDHLLIYAPGATFAATAAFYEAFLAPLGYTVKQRMAGDQVVGLGAGAKHPDFWICSTAIRKDQVVPGYAHFAFRADDHEAVDACYSAGIAAGGKDNGPPGLRTQYHQDYYAGFLHDPAGNCVEVVSRTD